MPRSGRRPTGEDPAPGARRCRSTPAGHNAFVGSSATPPTSASAPSIRWRPARRAPHRLRTERRARDARSHRAPGEEVRLAWSPDHTFIVATPSATQHTTAGVETVAAQEETTHDRSTNAAPGGSQSAPVPAGQRPGRHRRIPRCLRDGRAEQWSSPVVGGRKRSAAADASASAGPVRPRHRAACSGSRTGSATWTTTEDGSRFPTIEKFTAETGIAVEYATAPSTTTRASSRATCRPHSMPASRPTGTWSC